MALGGQHSCVVDIDLIVTCWGRNEHGQADPPDETFIALAAGDTHTCGLRPDRTITCWGTNHRGQADAPEGEFVTIAAGWNFSLCNSQRSHHRLLGLEQKWSNRPAARRVHRHLRRRVSLLRDTHRQHHRLLGWKLARPPRFTGREILSDFRGREPLLRDTH